MRSPKPVTIGTFQGAPIFLHPEAIVVALLCGLPLALQTSLLLVPLAAAALLASILAHEMGHIHAARRCGLPPIAIDLVAFGGLARFEDREHTPIQQAAIAAAGPAANFALALAFGTLAAILARTGIGSSLLGRLAVMNSALAIGNLMPAYPLDGGMICEALLAPRWGWRRTQMLVAALGLLVSLLAYVFMLALTLGGLPFLIPTMLGLNWRQLKQAWTAPIWWRGPTRKPYGWT